MVNPDTTPAATLLHRIETLIRAETAQQRELLERQWSLPLAERVRTGKAIEGLSVAHINEHTGHLVLECQTNNSKFRQGDYLFLHQSHPLLEPVIEVVLQVDEEQTLEVSPPLMQELSAPHTAEEASKVTPVFPMKGHEEQDKANCEQRGSYRQQ